MKKTLSFIISLIIIATVLLPVRVEAATAYSKAGTVSVSSGRLNVRSSNSSSSYVKTTLSKGSYVTLISQTGTWWKVEYADNQYGYCHADYIKTLSSSPMQVNITSGSLNVRTGPGTTYSKTGILYKGEIVLVLSSSGGWKRILFDGTKVGYVSSKYLTSVSTGNSAVALSVPSYKQTDSRWANTKIGSSGKTIAQIGCATTSVAMMESYRTGTTVYPNVMSKKLSYSSSGNVYWPSYYTVVTNSSEYLSAVYNLLKQGKPVLLGAKNSYGGQHWVVVTGFKGGTLSAANFTINDPGSDTRTTLQHFLNQYPTFYKFFYY